MDFLVENTPLEASRLAAQHMKNALRDVPSPVMMVPTGNTPRQLYQELVRDSSRNINWSRATVFALDEYIGVSPDDHRSFRFQLWEELCSPLGLSPSQLLSPNGLAEDPAIEAARYEQQLRDLGPASLCVLGVGSNGHIAFNEPGTSQTSVTHVATLSESTRADNQVFFEGQKVPTHALTVGISTVMACDRILLLAFGAKKRQALQELQASHPDSTFPITFLAHHPNLTVIADQKAMEGTGYMKSESRRAKQ